MPKPAVARPTGSATPAPAAARHAGLRWVNDAQPGWRRVARCGGFAYVDGDGRPVDDADAIARIRSLAIPPAWQEVWICPRADGHLQATGRDARGRKQYRYHPDFQSQRGQTKFDALVVFGAALPRIRNRVARTLARPVRKPDRDHVLAALVRLLDTTWLRIGNEAYVRENRSYGLSTLRSRHAGVRGDEIRLSFVGKSGVRHDVRLADRRVARIVSRCRELPGQELFRYVDDDGDVHRIDSADVNEYLAEAAGTRVTAKDFRTWHGSVLALDLTLAACAAGAPACRPQQVLQSVARRLGNTPAVCRKAYIHPEVLALGSALIDDATRAGLREQVWAMEAPPRRGLSAAERRLMCLLGSRRRCRTAVTRRVDQATQRPAARGEAKSPARGAAVPVVSVAAAAAAT